MLKLKFSSLVLLALAWMLVSCTSLPKNEFIDLTKSYDSTVTIKENWSLNKPDIDKVVFHGTVSDASGTAQPGSFLYPAPNAGGFIAAVITHGVVVDSIRNAEKSSKQKLADKVLDPFLPVLDNFSYTDLMYDWREYLHSPDTGKGDKNTKEIDRSKWTINSIPVFFVTQDLSGIVLDNLIRISDKDGKIIYQKYIKVVSRPMKNKDLIGYWLEDSGFRLKRTSVELFNESLNLVIQDLENKTNDNKYVTFRYYEGSKLKMERGQLISRKCNRLSINTLRGAPMSIPANADMRASNTGDCVNG